MKKIAALALVAALLGATPATANPRLDTPLPSIEQDIVGSGRVRLQSQRLAKLWLQAGLGIQAGAASAQLARGMTQVDGALAALVHLHRNENSRRAYERVIELWSEYRIALAMPYSEANLKTVNYLADDLMLAAGRLSARIESESEGGGGRLLDLSMRQNMLAQRLARLYLMAQAGDRSSGRIVDIEQARKEFATALRELSEARENTPASREALELASMQWLFFDRAIGEMKKGNDSKPQHVATSSERIMEVLDAVSQQYAADAHRLRLATTGNGGGRRN